MGHRTLRSHKNLERSGPCSISQVPSGYSKLPQRNTCQTSSTLGKPILEWNLYSKLLYYSNFLLFPIITLNHIDCWRCTSGLRSLGLHAVTLEQVVWLWGRTPLKSQNLIWNAWLVNKEYTFCTRNNWMKALGRPKFTNLVVIMYITLHVIFKKVLSDF